MRQFLKQRIITLGLLAGLLLTLNFVFAFSEPSSSPPLGNTPAPLNVSSSGQSKAGGLILNTGGASNGLIVDQGNVGIGTQSPSAKLDVFGDIKATAFYYSSDQRLKKDIEPIYNALEKIKQLNGIYFKWISNGSKQIGFIAQEVETVFPEIVSTDINSGYKSVQYGNLIAPLLEATKELDLKFETLSELIMAQQQQIEELKKQLTDIKNTLDTKK